MMWLALDLRWRGSGCPTHGRGAKTRAACIGFRDSTGLWLGAQLPWQCSASIMPHVPYNPMLQPLQLRGAHRATWLIKGSGNSCARRDSAVVRCGGVLT